MSPVLSSASTQQRMNVWLAVAVRASATHARGAHAVRRLGTAAAAWDSGSRAAGLSTKTPRLQSRARCGPPALRQQFASSANTPPFFSPPSKPAKMMLSRKARCANRVSAVISREACLAPPAPCLCPLRPHPAVGMAWDAAATPIMATAGPISARAGAVRPVLCCLQLQQHRAAEIAGPPARAPGLHRHSDRLSMAHSGF